VARTTAQIAEIDRANLIMVGWHRPAFSTNRLGGRVGQILTHAKVDVAVFVDRGRERLETLLVPYAANLHDDLGLELALRLLVNGDRRSLTVLRVVQNEGAPTELSNEFHTLMEQLPSSVRDRIDIQIVGSAEPIQAVVQASEIVDLTWVFITCGHCREKSNSEETSPRGGIAKSTTEFSRVSSGDYQL
jgi:hypothetical protein